VSASVLFRLDQRLLAAPLEQVQEVLRAAGVEGLQGTRAPVTGVLSLRGRPVPVVDLRSNAYPGRTGDALVVQTPPAPGVADGDVVVLAVDSVERVLGDGDAAAVRPAGIGLPDYVSGTTQLAGSGDEVLVVDLWRLAGLVPQN